MKIWKMNFLFKGGDFQVRFQPSIFKGRAIKTTPDQRGFCFQDGKVTLVGRGYTYTEGIPGNCLSFIVSPGPSKTKFFSNQNKGHLGSR